MIPMIISLVIAGAGGIAIWRIFKSNQIDHDWVILPTILGIVAVLVFFFQIGYAIYNWSGVYARDFSHKYQAAEAILQSSNHVRVSGNVSTMQEINEEILRNRARVDSPWRGAWNSREIASLELLVP